MPNLTFDLIEQLHGVGRNRQQVSNILVSRKDLESARGLTVG